MIDSLTLNDGSTCTIRETKSTDAALMIPYLESVARESNNLTFGPGEFTPSIQDEEEFITSHLKQDNCFGLVAIQEEKIIGHLSFEGGSRKRTNHIGEFGISVLKEFWGNGIATALIQNMLDWARNGPITKINLKVKEDNLSAIALYKKMGFEKEGIIKRDFKIDEKYYNSLFMGIITD